MRTKLAVSSTLLALALFAHTAHAAGQGAPSILSMNPKEGPAGTVVALLGRNFRPEYKVLLNGQELDTVVVTASQIFVLVPEGAEDGRFTIKGPGGQVEAKEAFRVTEPDRDAESFEKIGQVRLVDAQPRAAFVGQKVRLLGFNFDPEPAGNKVTLSGFPLEVASATRTSLEVIIKAGAASGSFQVETSKGGVTALTSLLFVVTARLTIASFEPASGFPGTRITVRGTGFDAPELRGTLGDAPLEIQVIQAEQVELTVPDGAAGGKLVLEAPGLGKAESVREFQLIPRVAVRDFRPRRGAPGQKVTLVGGGFAASAGDNAVTLAGKRVEVVQVARNELLVRIPDGAASGRFRVEVPGQRPLDVDGEFRVADKLSLAGFAPASGRPGTAVELTGTGFSNPGLMAFIGSVPAPLAAASSTKAKLTVPADARTSAIAVFAPGIEGATSTARFEVGEAPRVAAPAPASQPAAMPSATVAPALAPAAAPGPVTTPAPAPAAREKEDLELRITGFEPLKAAPGDVVEIHGNGFGLDASAVKVWVGNQPVSVEGVVPNLVIITAPKRAMKGVIKIQVGAKKPVKSQEVLKVTP